MNHKWIIKNSSRVNNYVCLHFYFLLSFVFLRASTLRALIMYAATAHLTRNFLTVDCLGVAIFLRRLFPYLTITQLQKCYAIFSLKYFKHRLLISRCLIIMIHRLKYVSYLYRCTVAFADMNKKSPL